MRLRTFVCLTVAAAAVATGLVTACGQRPRVTSGGPATINVKAGDDLQAAIDQAKYGDTVVLQAGATFVGPLNLRDKGTGADYITIRTSDLAGISRENERIQPAQHARSMPKIVSPSQLSSITTSPQAHHYRFIGVEFAPAANADYVYNLINLGEGNYTSLSQLPHHLVFDRCYVHSTGLNKARRGFALNSAETSIINSHVSGFAGAGDETQAIAGWNGLGPFHIINNYLEGGGEVVLFGGADPSITNLVPSDIEIRRNYLYKPAEWQGKAMIKAMFELKNTRRAVIDGNLLESPLRMTAFVITVRNQGGRAPWSTIEDVQITNNIVRHASTGVNILGHDNEQSSQEARRLRVAGNLFVDLVNPGDIGYFLQIGGGDSITVENNTVQHQGNVISSYGAPTTHFIFRDNIVQFNSYGIVCFTQGKTCPSGNPFCNCFPGGTFRGNLIVDNLGAVARESIDKRYPPGNYFPSSFEAVGFADYGRGNWRLGIRSPYRGKATNGKDPGVDINALNASGANSAAPERKAQP
jgi:hypothetical protein